MSANDYSEIIERSRELKEEFDNGLDEADKKMIDNFFSELEVFADNVNTDQIINFLDEKKFEVKDKNSERYLLLCIIYKIVFGIPIWAREHKFCEATFVRKFQEILDILFKNTKIFAKDGESSSEDGTQYGRKLDVLILSEQNDHDDIEVCSNEFKKPDATSTMKCYQQSKNLRLNACIWKKLFDISENIKGRKDRTAKSLENHWAVIQRSVSKSCGKVFFVNKKRKLQDLEDQLEEMHNYDREMDKKKFEAVLENTEVVRQNVAATLQASESAIMAVDPDTITNARRKEYYIRMQNDIMDRMGI